MEISVISARVIIFSNEVKILNEALEILKVEALYKTFFGKKGLFSTKKQEEVLAVDDVSFSVKQGETLGIVGQSGSGKSTLARLLIGLEQCDQGSILYKGRDISGNRDKKLTRQIQMVFQDSASTLDPRMAIKDILLEPLRIHASDMTVEDQEELIKQKLVEVNMPIETLDKYPHELSGGQQQRINIARALILTPDLIVFDEPTSSLDVSIQAQILNLLKRLQAEHNMTYIFITHDMGVVRFISERIIVMHHGKIVETGKTKEVISNPQDDYTKRLMDAIPIPDPKYRKYNHKKEDNVVWLEKSRIAY